MELQRHLVSFFDAFAKVIATGAYATARAVNAKASCHALAWLIKPWTEYAAMRAKAVTLWAFIMARFAGAISIGLL